MTQMKKDNIMFHLQTESTMISISIHQGYGASILINLGGDGKYRFKSDIFDLNEIIKITRNVMSHSTRGSSDEIRNELKIEAHINEYDQNGQLISPLGGPDRYLTDPRIWNSLLRYLAPICRGGVVGRIEGVSLPTFMDDYDITNFILPGGELEDFDTLLLTANAPAYEPTAAKPVDLQMPPKFPTSSAPFSETQQMASKGIGWRWPLGVAVSCLSAAVLLLIRIRQRKR